MRDALIETASTGRRRDRKREENEKLGKRERKVGSIG